MEFWFSEFHTPDVKHSIRVNKQLYSKQYTLCAGFSFLFARWKGLEQGGGA